jgi:hypothetical protein
VVSLASAATALAQGGDGSLRGTVKDDQGGALPGVTVTATSPALLSNSLAISDAAGNYRLINLPPGTYALTAELAGFSVFRREAVLLRAGANFRWTSRWPSARWRKRSPSAAIRRCSKCPIPATC